jgi:hypothetical protein
LQYCKLADVILTKRLFDVYLKLWLFSVDVVFLSSVFFMHFVKTLVTLCFKMNLFRILLRQNHQRLICFFMQKCCKKTTFGMLAVSQSAQQRSQMPLNDSKHNQNTAPPQRQVCRDCGHKRRFDAL